METRTIHRQLLLVSMGSRICSDVAASPQMATKQAELSSELVVDNTLPRCRWLLGRVTKVFPGEDARVRTAEVKTKTSKLVRPVTKLCLLEEAT